MKTTEMVMNFLKEQGFCPQIDEDNGNIIFKYQMRTFVFINNDDDDDEFFQLAIPSVDRHSAQPDNLRSFCGHCIMESPHGQY